MLRIIEADFGNFLNIKNLYTYNHFINVSFQVVSNKYFYKKRIFFLWQGDIVIGPFESASIILDT